MLKLSNNHDIWEVWCEYAAESVFIDHKPNKEELEDIQQKNWDRYWNVAGTKLKIYKLKPFYTRK